jgi:hypothetical protein
MTRTNAFIFMKVGDHAGESWEQILERKNREYQDAGKIFWGYGGTACHPLSQVQPFVKEHAAAGDPVYLLMEPIHSLADPDVLPATEFSADGINWEPIPQGINVTGSRYALVLDEIRPGQLDLNPAEYVVGIGPSRGKRASNYLQGRVDKACLQYSQPGGIVIPGENEKIHEVRYTAKLLEPYAVLLRNNRNVS